MAELVVAAQRRSQGGKNVNRRLRAQGRIPGILYGARQESVAVSVAPKEIGAILRSASGENTLFDLDLEGSRRKVLIKEFQVEPVKGRLLHADFYEVALDKVITVKVHIELEGTPVGVKLQGVRSDAPAAGSSPPTSRTAPTGSKPKPVTALRRTASSRSLAGWNGSSSPKRR